MGPVSGPKGKICRLRPPVPADGPRVTQLIAACPPLDRNSSYCNLLQCSHFAPDCILAETPAGRLLGWISGYRPPAEPDAFFVWQVAVHPDARGMGLAGRLLEALLGRPHLGDVSFLLTTITADNRASWALFSSMARRWGVPLERQPFFEREAHFNGAHESEWLARIGPLAGNQQNRREKI